MLRVLKTFDSDVAVGTKVPGPVPYRTDVETERKLEAWVVSNLGGKVGAEFGTQTDWQASLEVANGLRKDRIRIDAPNTRAGAPKGWEHVRVVPKRGATIVRVLSAHLLKDTDIRGLAEELYDLITAGFRRLALDFRAVERLSSQIVGVLLECDRRIRESGDGAIRVFGLRPDIAPVIALGALTQRVEVHTDENAALDAAWPQSSGLPQIPDAILAALAPVAPPDQVEPSAPSKEEAEVSATAIPESASERYWLVVEFGPAKGQLVAIKPKGFRIGRDASCKLRSGNAALSRLHAEVKLEAGRVILRDLGSTNGTLVNGRLVRGRAIEVRSGDQIEIGPLRFSVLQSELAVAREEQILNWLGLETDDAFKIATDADDPPTQVVNVAGFEPASRCAKVEVIEGVTVVTPFESHLCDESALAPLRTELLSLLEQNAPKRLAINLEYVVSLSGQAIGMLVAHHLRLDRVGGALRLCGVNARVAMVIDKIRLPMLLDVYGTVEDAVLQTWPQRQAAS